MSGVFSSPKECTCPRNRPSGVSEASRFWAVFFGAGGFTDDEPFGAAVAYAEDALGSRGVEGAFGAAEDLGFDGFPLSFGFCGDGGAGCAAWADDGDAGQCVCRAGAMRGARRRGGGWRSRSG